MGQWRLSKVIRNRAQARPFDFIRSDTDWRLEPLARPQLKPENIGRESLLSSYPAGEACACADPTEPHEKHEKTVVRDV